MFSQTFVLFICNLLKTLMEKIRKSSKEGKLKFKSYKTRDVIDLEDSTKPRILPPGEKSKPFTRV